MNLVQLSDTHFGTENPIVMKALQRCLYELDNDLIVITGDITQRARKGQFIAAKAFFESLSTSPILTVPGNHDIPLFNLLARFFWPFHNYQTYMSEQLQPVYTSNKLWLICLNTVQRFKHVSGQVNAEQVEWVNRHLKVAPENALKVVVAHHPFAVVLQDDTDNLIKGAEAALQQWSQLGLNLVLGGHIHFPFAEPLNKHFTDLQGDPWVVQAGTAISKRVRNNMQNSFVRLQLGKKQCDLNIQRWDYSHEQERFIEVERVHPWG